MTTLSLPDFMPGLPAAQVDASLRQALGACDRARECAVLWFAEVRRRELYRTYGYASLELYAVHALGFSRNRTWQFKRLADEFDRLPALREAVAGGELGWTKARHIARVASPATAAAWVEKAKASGRRELEREVTAAQASARGQRAARAEAPEQHPGGSSPVGAPATITLRADALQLARFESLVERARKTGAVPRGTDRMDLVLAALEALVESDDDEPPTGPGRRPRPAAPAARIVIHECPDCRRATAATGRGERPLAPPQLAAAKCDAILQEPGKRNRATVPPAVRAAVLARDRHRCAAPGCGSARFLEVHHVVPREEGGSNQADNLVTLCGRCHRFAHEKARREAVGLGDGA